MADCFERRSTTCWAGRDGRARRLLRWCRWRKALRLPVYVRPEIKTWEDLRGKPLAVDAVDTAYALVLRRIFLAHDLDHGPGRLSACRRGHYGAPLGFDGPGETFAGSLNPPWDGKAEAAGMVRFADHREVLPDYPGGVFAVGRNWARGKSSDVGQDFCALGTRRCVGATRKKITPPRSGYRRG